MSGQTPFVTGTVAYPGLGQPKVLTAPTGIRTWWLGSPGSTAGMIQLPYPSNGFDVLQSSGLAASTSLGGATTSMRRRRRTRIWRLHWNRMAGRDWQIIDGFYQRAFGLAPWALVTPESVNRIEFFASLCGSGNGALEGWAASAGTVVYDSTLASPVLPSGVMRWSGAGSGSLLVQGTVPSGVPTPDATLAAPYLPAEPVTFSCWASTASGTASFAARLSGRTSSGTLVTEVTGSTVTLTTTPQLVSVSTAAGGLTTSPYVMPVLRCGTASAPNILIAAPQLEYSATATSWALGSGVPRVTIPEEPTRSVDGVLVSAVTLVLAE